MLRPSGSEKCGLGGAGDAVERYLKGETPLFSEAEKGIAIAVRGRKMTGRAPSEIYLDGVLSEEKRRSRRRSGRLIAFGWYGGKI